MPAADRVYNVLFLCTGNSARSVLGEVLVNAIGHGRFKAYSAGSHPKGEVHPLTLRVLAEAGLPTEGLRSKSWDEFAAPGAPQMDFVFTVCDDAAGEACPLWPGKPLTAHWGIEDPARATGTELARLAAFEDALRYMRNRVAAFLALPLESIDRMTLSAKIKGIGGMDAPPAKPAMPREPTPMLSYEVHAHRIDAHGSVALCKGAEIVLDTDVAGRTDAFNPAELFLASIAACMIKGIERVTPMIHFAFRGAEVKLTAERQDAPPRIVSIGYELVVDTDESDQRLELLHTNVRKYGTIFNTVSAATRLEGVIRRKGAA